MSSLIKPYSILEPMECFMCGGTYFTATFDVEMSAMKKNGEVIKTDNFYHKTVAICPDCGNKIDVLEYNMKMFQNIDAYKIEHSNILLKEDIEKYTNTKDSNIFDKEDINEEIIRKYS